MKSYQQIDGMKMQLNAHCQVSYKSLASWVQGELLRQAIILVLLIALLKNQALGTCLPSTNQSQLQTSLFVFD